MTVGTRGAAAAQASRPLEQPLDGEQRTQARRGDGALVQHRPRRALTVSEASHRRVWCRPRLPPPLFAPSLPRVGAANGGRARGWRACAIALWRLSDPRHGSAASTYGIDCSQPRLFDARAGLLGLLGLISRTPPTSWASRDRGVFYALCTHRLVLEILPCSRDAGFLYISTGTSRSKPW